MDASRSAAPLVDARAASRRASDARARARRRASRARASTVDARGTRARAGSEDAIADARRRRRRRARARMRGARCVAPRAQRERNARVRDRGLTRRRRRRDARTAHFSLRDATTGETLRDTREDMEPIQFTLSARTGIADEEGRMRARGGARGGAGRVRDDDASGRAGDV